MVDSGSVSTFLNVSTSGRSLIRCHAAYNGVVKQIHGTSRSTTPGGALRLRPFWIIAMPSPDATNTRPTSIIQRVADVDEVANLVAYIASPLSSATTGAALRVDGGVVDSLAI